MLKTIMFYFGIVQGVEEKYTKKPRPGFTDSGKVTPAECLGPTPPGQGGGIHTPHWLLKCLSLIVTEGCCNFREEKMNGRLSWLKKSISIFCPAESLQDKSGPGHHKTY